MAGSKTDYLENRILDLVLKNNATYGFSSPATVYVALLTAVSSDGGSPTEVTNANSYARQAITFGTISNGSVSNSGQVNFPTATGGSWGNIVAFMITTSGTYGGGSNLYWGDFGTAKTIGIGDTASIPIGGITITEE